MSGPSNWEQVEMQLDEQAEKYTHGFEIQTKDWLKVVTATRIWENDKRLDIRQWAVSKGEPDKGFVATRYGVVIPDRMVVDWYNQLTELLTKAGYFDDDESSG